MNRIALDAGLSKRFQHVKRIREGTSSLDHIHSDHLYSLEDNLELLFGNVVRALDKENDLLKVYIRNTLPADPGNVAPSSMSDPEHETQSQSLGRQTKTTDSANSPSVSSAAAQPVESVQSEDPIVPIISGNKNGSTPIKSTSSKQSRKSPKNPAKFPCTSCGKRFTRSTTLREHMRSHSNERPYHCPSCPKQFSRLKDQKRHQELHSTERNVVCKGLGFDRDFSRGCGRRFAREDGLSAHWRTKAGWECLTKDLSFVGLQECVFICLDDLNFGEPIQCTKALDLVFRGIRRSRLRECGCDKSYRSAKDFWDQHLCLDEGKDCLRELLTWEALSLSRFWAECQQEESELDDWGEPESDQTIVINEEDAEIEMKDSTSDFPRTIDLQETEWTVLDCKLDNSQQRIIGHLKAPYEIDPAEASFLVDFRYFRGLPIHGTWTEDRREFRFTWTLEWKNLLDIPVGILEANVVLNIVSRQQEAFTTLGFLTIEHNRLSEFQPKNLVSQHSKNQQLLGTIEHPGSKAWKILTCEYDEAALKFSIRLKALLKAHFLSLVDMLKYGLRRDNFTLRMIFGVFKDGPSHDCSWTVVGDHSVGIDVECALSTVILADRATESAVPCFLEVLYLGQTAVLPLGKLACQNGEPVGFTPFSRTSQTGTVRSSTNSLHDSLCPAANQVTPSTVVHSSRPRPYSSWNDLPSIRNLALQRTPALAPKP